MEPLKLAFVPTAGLRKDWLRAETIERLEITHDMYAKRVINRVFLSAKDTADERTAIDMMRDWLTRRDVPQEAIICDATTPPDGDRSLPLIDFLKRTSYTPPVYLYVVTGWYHMPRCVKQIKERLRQFESQLPNFRGRTAVITRVKTATPVSHCVGNLIAEPFRLLRFYWQLRQGR
jgi:hypothetical protein